MYTHDRRLHTTLQVLMDLLSIGLIWYFTMHARVLLNPVMSLRLTADEGHGWVPPLFLVLPLWALAYFVLRLYRPPNEVDARSLITRAFENAALLTTVTALIVFFSRQFGELVSRMFVPITFPVGFLVLMCTRFAAVTTVAVIGKRGLRPLRVALVGDWRKATQVVQRIQAAHANMIRGLIVPEAAVGHAVACPLPVLGTTGQIAELISKERLDRVILLNAALPLPELAHCTEVSGKMGVPVTCALDFVSEPVRVDLHTDYGLPFIEMAPVQFAVRQQMVKRVFDVIVAAASIVMLAPALAMIAALIKLTSKGPVLYKSWRVGKGGRHFMFFKFRSMYVDSTCSNLAEANEKDGHIFKIREDPRVTPIGRFLRRYSLDELPQLINILRGEMSLVGPRPLPASNLEPDGMSTQFAAWSEGRARVHPGLTGLWQVSGRSELKFEDMVRLDLSYIQNWSLGLDVRIMLDTPLLVLRGVGAY
jgi:exopolysaccharide biosynthesis polyprenyl glycosylphosphotransferase